MFGNGLFLIFLLYFPSSFAQSCSSQIPSGNLNRIISENFANDEDIAKLLLVKKCLSNLEDCAKSISLQNVTQEIIRSLDTIGKENSINFCEGENGYIHCPSGSVIEVHDGFYGRMDKTTCPSVNITTTNCKANDTLEALKRDCNNNSTCIIVSSNFKYGDNKEDPCPGTKKYVSVTYSCQNTSKAEECFALKGSNRAYRLTSQRYNCQGAKDECHQKYNGTLATFEAKNCANRKLVGSYFKLLYPQITKMWVKEVKGVKLNIMNKNLKSPCIESNQNSSDMRLPTQRSSGRLKDGENIILMNMETFQLIDAHDDNYYYGLCEINNSEC